MAGTIASTSVDGIVTIIISNPAHKNAATRQMFIDLAQAFSDAQGARAVLLRGDGSDFCTGADLSDPEGMAGQSPLEFMRSVGEAALRLHELKIPTVAVVDGLAVGAGLSLAVGCDLVIASRRARFSAIFARRGLSLDLGASWFLPRRVGMAKAKELTLLAEMVDANEALAIGLVNRVVANDELHQAGEALVLQLATSATLALSRSNTLLDQSAHRTLAEALEAEAQAQVGSFESYDTIEAAHAFIEKRLPRFQGR